MKKTIVITDVTQMPADRNMGNEVCVVGIDATGRCIRPICEGGFLKQYLYDTKRSIIVRHGARVEFDLYSIDTQPPHIEDMRFEPISITGKGLCSISKWESILRTNSFETVEKMYEGFLRDLKWVMPCAKTRSIATLSGASIIDVELTSRSIKPRITFVDRSGSEFNRTASDLTLWDRCFSLVRRQGRSCAEVERELVTLLQSAERLYLRLGLARPWEREEGEGEKCWLQVTGVYTFPDYLEGKTFADFLPQ